MEYVLDCINNHVVPFDGDDFHEALRLGRQAIATEESSAEQDPYASEEETNNLIQPDTRTPEQKQHDALVDENWGNEQGAEQEQKREWVGLTTKEIYECDAMPQHDITNSDLQDFAFAIEAKLKEKNT